VSDLPTEFLENWAAVGDNRFAPILGELVEAVIDCDDPDKLKRIASRLKFLSSSVNSHANRLITKQCETRCPKKS
jgi:hypothetical protein